jgi:hypothetical protein
VIVHNPAYRRLLWFLLWSGHRETDGGVVLTVDTCAELEDKLHERDVTQNYRAHPFLSAFDQDVIPLNLQESRYTQKRARVARPVFPAEVLEQLNQERERTRKRKVPKVYYDSGMAVTYKREWNRLKDQEADLAIAIGDEPATGPLLTYLNHHNQGLFNNAVDAHLDEAWNLALAIENPVVREQQIQTLDRIREQPKPFYCPSSRGATDRIFPASSSILTLKSSIRRTLTQDWAELDLKSSQLAICGKLWGCPKIQKFLAKDGDIWLELFTYFGFDPKKMNDRDRADIKQAFKISVYASVFGMWIVNIHEMLNENPLLEALGPKRGQKLTKHPLIRELLNQRGLMVDLIIEQGHISTCTGRSLVVNRDLNPGEQRRQAYSFMAQQAQAVELELMVSVLPLLVNTNDANIALWMHDGISLAVRNQKQKQVWVRMCADAVRFKARELGIPTYLEWTNRPVS